MAAMTGKMKYFCIQHGSQKTKTMVKSIRKGDNVEGILTAIYDINVHGCQVSDRGFTTSNEG